MRKLNTGIALSFQGDHMVISRPKWNHETRYNTEKGTFTGYDKRSKGYRIYIDEQKSNNSTNCKIN